MCYKNEWHNSPLYKVNWSFLSNVERGKTWPLMAATPAPLRAMAKQVWILMEARAALSFLHPLYALQGWLNCSIFPLLKRISSPVLVQTFFLYQSSVYSISESYRPVCSGVMLPYLVKGLGSAPRKISKIISIEIPASWIRHRFVTLRFLPWPLCFLALNSCRLSGIHSAFPSKAFKTKLIKWFFSLQLFKVL